MPSFKTWHFETLNGIKIHRNGKPLVNKKGGDLGYIKALQQPNKASTCAAAEKFLDHAIQVTFAGNLDVVLNREDFQWNKNDFCRHFKNLTDAYQFLTVWGRVTRYDRAEGGRFVCLSSDDDSLTLTDSDCVASDSQADDEATPPNTAAGHKRNNDGKIIHKNLMDDSILKKKVGLFNLPVLSLQEAKIEHLIRSTDEIFLAHLKDRIREDPSGPGVAPLAVLCTSVDAITNFSEKWLAVYKYEVLGGQHTAVAKKELLKENPTNSFFKDILAEVYVGLTSDEALRLGSRHNKNGHFIHKMTHRDYVETCRSKLFAMNGVKPGSGIDPSPSNEWKQVCNRCILPEEISRSQRDNIFAQSSLKEPVWNLFVQVMDGFEDGRLKDQKLSRKQNISKPEFRQQYIQPIQCLPADFQLEKLQLVVDKKIPLSQLKEEASKYRSMESIKKAFRSVTNVSSWDEAVQRFPSHTSASVLESFCHLSFQKSIPQSFISFCQSALQKESITDSDENDHLVHNGVLAFFVKVSFKEATLSKIRSGNDKFMGAHLSLVRLTKDIASDDIKQLIYTSRQINTLPERSLTTYNFVILCNMSIVSLVKELMTECYNNITILYCFNNTEELSSKAEFVSKLGAIVVGHFSIDPNVNIYREHINIKAARNDLFEYTTDYNLFEQLVATFSFIGQVVLDGTETGLVSVAALKNRRSSVTLSSTGINMRELIEQY